jgi:DNA-binding beta-propeller fold protein YncE
MPRQLFSLLLLSMSAMFAGPNDQGLIITANKGEHTVGIIDPVSLKQIAAIPENGVTGHEVITSPDGKLAYVPIYGNSGVGKPGTDGSNMIVVDIAARKVVGNVDFGKGVRPHCPVFDAKRNLLYVSTELNDTISIIDPKTLKIVGAVPTGQPESHMFALSHAGHLGYTANVGPGTVSVLDMDAHKTLAVIPISKETQRISISPDDSMVFTADQTKPQLAVIDTKSNTVKHWIPLDGFGYGTAPTSDGKYLVVAVPGKHQVAIVDLATLTVVHTVAVPAAPQAVVIRPDDLVAYVSCDQSNQVAAVDLRDWSVKVIEAGKGTDGITWAVGR